MRQSNDESAAAIAGWALSSQVNVGGGPNYWLMLDWDSDFESEKFVFV